MTKDKITGILVVILGTIWMILSYQIEGNAYSTTIGPDLFPKLASGGMMICGLGLILRKPKGEKEHFLDREGWIRVAKITVVIAAFPVILVYFGFIIAAIAVLFASTSLFDIENSVSIVKRGIFSVTTALVLFTFFTYVLDVILPSGKLFGLF